MTTIFHVKDDGIYTDSRYVRKIVNRTIIDFGPKAFLSKNKQYIYAISGYTTHHDNDRIEAELENHILSKLDDFPYDNFKTNELSFVFPGTTQILIITKKKVIVGEPLNEKSKMLGFTDITDLPCFSLGTGGAFTEGHFEVMGDAMKAMEETLTVDPSSGGEIHYISYSELEEVEA